MARNGNVNLKDLLVSTVVNQKTGGSRLVASRQQGGQTYTVTIEVTGKFPDDMIARPDDTLDVGIAYDPKVSA